MASFKAPSQTLSEKSSIDLDLERQHSTTTSEHDSDEGEEEPTNPPLRQTRSHISAQDISAAAQAQEHLGSNNLDPENDNPIYDSISPNRKILITCIMSYAASLSPMSSTTIMSAVPEVAATFNTDGTIINLSNAAYLLAMAASPIVYGPLIQIYGKRWPSIISALLFFFFSIGSALAPNLASFFVFRIFTAFQGTAFIILGSAVVGDIYRPTQRGTYLGLLLTGTLVGPTLGPFIGGIIVTYTSWRAIFWLQSGLGALGLVLVYFGQPETSHADGRGEFQGLTKTAYARKLVGRMSPLRVLGLLRAPNLLLCGLASSALVWNMYSLLTPIRYVLNPRFGLTSPLQSGLFYIAPGCGYLLGTLGGGRYADFTVRKWKKKRGGYRVPEDRLRSCLIAMGVVIPACMLLYGWSIEFKKGGVPLPVIVMFLQGVAQLFCFPSLNVYCLDVQKERAAEIIAGNYAIRYLFGAVGTAVVLPAVRTIGVGWFSTISALFLVTTTIGVWLTTIYGETWREWMDEKAKTNSEVEQSGEK